MTPKEKAISIVHQMYGTLFHTDAEPAHVKQCALIAVDEIILEQCKGRGNTDARYQDERLIYWQEVKQEIQNL